MANQNHTENASERDTDVICTAVYELDRARAMFSLIKQSNAYRDMELPFDISEALDLAHDSIHSAVDGIRDLTVPDSRVAQVAQLLPQGT